VNRPLMAPDVPVDLSNCDLEPIHIPSLIQSHGMLLAARDSDLRVVYASANSLALMGVTPAFILERTLTDVLGAEAVAAIERALGHETYLPKDIHSFTFPISGDRLFDVTANRTQGLLCIELEVTLEPRRWDLLVSHLETATRSLAAKTSNELYDAIPPLLREFTGYDRIMVYKFDPDGHGEVIGEAKAPEMEPFLGLHYPATDIPQQARKLYLQQRFRTIVDVNYVPVPLLGNRDLTHDEPLDMTFCSLRSPSPIHIEYLQNMGVGATLVISLIQSGELWGLIVGHHRTSKHLTPDSRVLCDLLGQLISVLVGVAQQADAAIDYREKESLLDLLRAPMDKDLMEDNGLAGSAQTLLELTRADGAIVRLGGRLTLLGSTPALSESTALFNAFQARLQEETLSTDMVGNLFPAFAHLASQASGALLVPFQEPSEGILWLRGEIAQTVRWAGKPEASKQFSEGSIRISPRKSFALWEEVQHGRSLPWLPGETEAALGVQRVAVRALLVRSEKQLAVEQFLREKRVEALTQMAAGLAHEISNPLAIIDGVTSDLAQLAQTQAPVDPHEVSVSCETILKTVKRASNILGGLRGFAREATQGPMELASIYEIVDQCLELQLDRLQRHHVDLRIDMNPGIPSFLCREVQIGQIVSNLINNAFDAITQSDVAERWIELTIKLAGLQICIEITDSGPGIDDSFKAHLMEPFFTTKHLGLGVGVGLSLSRAIAQDHTGTLTLLDNTEHTTFRLTLPIGAEPVAHLPEQGRDSL